jgi:hypothetical protein
VDTFKKTHPLRPDEDIESVVVVAQGVFADVKESPRVACWET